MKVLKYGPDGDPRMWAGKVKCEKENRTGIEEGCGATLKINFGDLAKKHVNDPISDNIYGLVVSCPICAKEIDVHGVPKTVFLAVPKKYAV